MASDLVSAFGQFESGQASEQAYEFNAKIAEQNAAQTRLASAQEERMSRIQARKEIGSMRAAYGASGVTMEGSPMEVLAESVAMAELDALNIRHAGEMRARGYQMEAASSRFSGASARTAARIGAVSSLMKGAEKLYNPTASLTSMFKGGKTWSGSGGPTSGGIA